MRTVDTIIIGGGPAGASCAAELVRAGREVLVLDRAEFPREKLCAGWITEKVMRDLDFTPETYPKGILPLKIRTHFPRLPFGLRFFPTPGANYSIRRVEFDAWLLERSGAPVERHQVKDIARDGDGFVLDGAYRCRHLVGAGGTMCPVRRAFFPDSRKRGDQIVTLEREFDYPARDDLCRLYFFRRGLSGYSWYVPKAEGVVNIGIGGSHLGPEMATRALAPYHDGPRCHFVSNVDGADIADTLDGLDPERTLFLVVSKTFTTVETMTNAATARDWLTSQGRDPGAQMAAVSSATDRTADWGIDAGRVFGFGDYVGGRYSVWGPVGLALMIAIGPDRFTELLAGGAAMDAHFRTAPPARNMPVMLALTGLWHHQGCGHPTRAVLPYDQRLARLPAYLQQLEMESNGKGVTLAGAPAPAPTGPVVWGEPGTNGQHAFYQLIHQGTRIVPCEFLAAATGHEPALAHQHDLLLANCLAQAEALLVGRPTADTPHRVFPGNRPSTMLIYEQLTPHTLGRIIALYEHRVFVEGVIWGINSFDQWGVELGKELAKEMLPLLQDQGGAGGKDGSTAGLLDALAALRN